MNLTLGDLDALLERAGRGAQNRPVGRRDHPVSRCDPGGRVAPNP